LQEKRSKESWAHRKFHEDCEIVHDFAEDSAAGAPQVDCRLLAEEPQGRGGVTNRLIVAVACFPLALSFSAGDFGRLNAGEAVVQILPSTGPNVAIRAAARANVGGDRLVAWTRHVERLQTGPYQSSAGRFSDRPRIEDLDQLFLDHEDLMDLRRCRPAHCGLKLEDHEIERLRQAIAGGGSRWKAAAEHTFRQIVLARTERYLAEGHAGTSYHDEKTRVLLDQEFAALASQFALEQPRFGSITDYLAKYPAGQEAADVESFLYWSKDSLGARPIVSVTHVAMIESRNPAVPEAIVARKQVYASHYINASLSMTAITITPDGGHRYLVYLNHTRADVFDGIFGGLIRRTIERRLRREGPQVLQALRRRLESGEE
jgi:hypothetical protein